MTLYPFGSMSNQLSMSRCQQVELTLYNSFRRNQTRRTKYYFKESNLDKTMDDEDSSGSRAQSPTGHSTTPSRLSPSPAGSLKGILIVKANCL